jgi:2-keto-4-pentenoate hydratase
MTPVSNNLQIMIAQFHLRSHADLIALHKIAETFVAARRHASALPAYPGTLPARLADAYLVQDHAIAVSKRKVAGWKVGFIAPQSRDDDGDERVLGPIFEDLCESASHSAQLFERRFVPGGFAAVEAEYVFRLGTDLNPSDKHASNLADAVSSVHLGVECAGSPLKPINVIGPMAVASDFGNNNGLIIGPALPIAQLAEPSTWQNYQAKVWVNDQLVGQGLASNVPGTPWRAFEFAVKRLLQRGYRLPSDTLIATGASTGIHDVKKGDIARIGFSWLDAQEFEIRCRIAEHAPRADISNLSESG